MGVIALSISAVYAKLNDPKSHRLLKTNTSIRQGNKECRYTGYTVAHADPYTQLVCRCLFRRYIPSTLWYGRDVSQ